MNRKNFYRIALLGITAAVLAACGTKKTKPGIAVPPVQQPPAPPVIQGEPLPAGTPAPEGFVHSPGGGASYKAVSHNPMPQWNEQNFADSLRSFRLGCEKLQAQPNWRNVCAQAAQTPYK
ncbi:murein transglycosylase, partial [Bacillus stratosphericus]